MQLTSMNYSNRSIIKQRSHFGRPAIFSIRQLRFFRLISWLDPHNLDTAGHQDTARKGATVCFLWLRMAKTRTVAPHLPFTKSHVTAKTPKKTQNFWWLTSHNISISCCFKAVLVGCFSGLNPTQRWIGSLFQLRWIGGRLVQGQQHLLQLLPPLLGLENPMAFPFGTSIPMEWLT